jgi:Ca2+-binding EF-hand superfamily protein
MRQFIALSLAGAALLAGGVAYAQAEGTPAPNRAPLTRADIEQRSAARFARMDVNQDGKLDRADREARRGIAPADRRKAAFERIDADGDGAISFEEFSAVREQRAERRGPDRRGGRRIARGADTNRDGTVTQAEFASAALAGFDRIDVDKDGTISASERPARRMMRRERRMRDAS